jgi:predicted nucleic acid-binding protein
MKYLVDTDWAIDHLHNVRRVVQRLEELTPEGLGVSIVTLAELYEGILTLPTPKATKEDYETSFKEFL